MATPLQRIAMLEAVAADHFAVAESSVHATHRPSGAPQLDVDGTFLHASIAHSGDLLLIGFAPRPIGVDIERIGEAREPPWNVLAPTERVSLAGIGDPTARHIAFLRIWTLKESALKALGTGLAREPSSLAVAPEGNQPQLYLDGSPLCGSRSRVETSGGDSNGFVWACVVL